MDDTNAPAGLQPAPDARFEWRFRLEAGDYAALIRQFQFHAVERLMGSPMSAAVGAFGALAGLIVWTTVAALLLDAADPVNEVIAIALGALGMMVLFRTLIYPAYLRSVFDGQPSGMGDTVFIADADGLRAISDNVTTSFGWSRLLKINATKDHVFLMFSRLGGLIVARRIFNSPDQEERFAAFLRSKAPSSA